MSSKVQTKKSENPFAELEKSMSESATELGKNINTLFKAMQTEKDESVLIHAFTTAFKSFLSHKKKLKMPCFSNVIEKTAEGEKQVNQFASWVQQNYQRFLQLLMKLFRHKKEAVRQAAMRLFTENIFPSEAALWGMKGEPIFPVRLLERVFVNLIQLPIDTPAVTNVLTGIFVSEFVNNYADAYLNLTTCIRTWAESKFVFKVTKEGELAKAATTELSGRVDEDSTTEDESAVIFSLLMRLSPPAKQANVAKTVKGIKGKIQTNLGSSEKLEKPTLATSSREILISEERKHYQDAWLGLAKAPTLSEGVIRGLLGVISNKVLPYLSSPLQTADLYIRSYDIATENANKNNYIAEPRKTPFSRTVEELQSSSRRKEIIRSACTRVAALSGLFSLIARYKMGDTDIVGGQKSGDAVQEEQDLATQAADSFFVRLYKCITPAVFRIEGAADSLLRLADMSLRSNLVPHRLKAAFCKKLIRVATLVPAPSAVALLAIVASLMQRNKSSLRGLVDLSREASHMWACKGDSVFEFAAAPVICDAAEIAANAVEKGEVDDERAALVKKRMRKLKTGDNEVEIYSDEDELTKTEQDELRQEKRQRFLKESEGAFERSLQQLASISLWELTALRRHINPSVAQVANFYWSDFLNKPFDKPVDVPAAMGHTECSLLESYLKQRMTSLPAVAVKPPKKLVDLDELFAAMEFERQSKKDEEENVEFHILKDGEKPPTSDDDEEEDEDDEDGSDYDEDGEEDEEDEDGEEDEEDEE